MAPLTCSVERHEPRMHHLSPVRRTGACGPRRPAWRGECPPTPDVVAHLPWAVEDGASGFASVNDPHTPSLPSPLHDNAFGFSPRVRRTGTSSPPGLGADERTGDDFLGEGRSPLKTKLDDVDMLALESKLQLVRAQRQLSAVRCEAFLQDLERALSDVECAAAAAPQEVADAAAAPVAPPASDASATASSPARAHSPRSPQIPDGKQHRRLHSVGSRSSNRSSSGSGSGRPLHRATSETCEECVGESPPAASATRPLRPLSTLLSLGRARSSSPCLAASHFMKPFPPSHSPGAGQSSIGATSDDACSSNTPEKQTSASTGDALASPRQYPKPPPCSSPVHRTTSSPSLIGLTGSPSHASVGQTSRRRRARSLFPLAPASPLSPTSDEIGAGPRSQPMPWTLLQSTTALAARGPTHPVHDDAVTPFQEASAQVDCRGGEVEWGAYSLTGSSAFPPHQVLTGQRLRQQRKSRLHKSKRRTSFSFDDLDEICAYALREDAGCPT